jgi:hypothetical protein
MSNLQYKPEIDSLLKLSREFLNSVYIFSVMPNIPNKNQHTACFIHHNLGNSMTEDFLNNLFASITDYVYTQEKQQRFLSELSASETNKINRLFFASRNMFRKNEFEIPKSIDSEKYMEILNPKLTPEDKAIIEKVYTQKRKKFKLVNNDLNLHSQVRQIFEKCNFDYKRLIAQGQFSELLLYNILMNHFKAPPLVHKMAITTNPQLERNGVDALHVGYQDDELTLFIGESKAYLRASGSFKAAIEDSTIDVIAHYEELGSELNLYLYDSNISPGLEKFISELNKGSHRNIKINLVCMVTYNKEFDIAGLSNNFEEETREMILSDFKGLNKDFFDGINQHNLEKVHYVVFPINGLSGLVVNFQRELGL